MCPYFALKANPRLASNLKSFIIKISCCVLLDVVPRSQTQQFLFFLFALRRLEPATYNELCSQIKKGDKPRKGSCLPPCPSIHFVKPAYVTEEEFKQLKQTALTAPSQSTNPVSPNPHQATCLPTLTPKPLPIPPLSLMLSLSQAQMKAMFIPPIPSPSHPLISK
ncbi:hypothetical protein DSO57_1023915 [Entomophthora muscae]|uniref:Uncharacterized protein n=1 Tax=Entomophthora muscae TaxID=34485 RepID=A0ACC2T389_9FUNG|nr:hypothetical protein DSO57_1023915 [Entomophthora muscae]